MHKYTNQQSFTEKKILNIPEFIKFLLAFFTFNGGGECGVMFTVDTKECVCPLNFFSVYFCYDNVSFIKMFRQVIASH